MMLLLDLEMLLPLRTEASKRTEGWRGRCVPVAPHSADPAESPRELGTKRQKRPLVRRTWGAK